MTDLPKSPPPQSTPLSSPTEATTTTTTTTTPPVSNNSNNPFTSNGVVFEEPRERSDPIGAPPVNTVTRPLNDAPIDPAVAELKAMFPDYDEIILQSVLQSTNGNQGTAIDILLGMSDPNYKSEAIGPQIAMSQTELDEQLARRLMLEEQEQQQVRWHQTHGPLPQRRGSRYGQGQQAGNLWSQSPPPSGGQPATGDKDTMTDIQEQISKAAEVGKKTFGDLFTKVKAKIQEFERGGSGSGNAPSTQWAGGYDPHDPHQTPYQQYHPQASYYDPNSPITLSSQTSPPQGTPAPAVQGFDAAPNVVTPPPPTNTTTTGARAISPIAQSTSSSIPAPNPASAPIDAGKLGLLPKRPVSLIPDPPAGQQAKGRPNDSDDDLEYAENPFEDQKK